MKLRHAILLSGVCHLCLLGYTYLAAEPTVEEPELPTWLLAETAEFAQPQQQKKSTSLARLRVEPKAAEGGDGAEGDAEAESEAASKPEAKPESEPKSKPEPKPEPKSKPKPEQKPKPKPEPKPEKEPDPEPKPEVEPVVAQKESTEEEAPEVEKPSESSSETDVAEETSGEAVASASQAGTSGGEGTESGSSGEGSGEGDGSGEGVGGGDGPGGGNVDRGRLIRGYATSIYKVLARHQRYPRLARRAGFEGIAKVTVTIDEAGNILDVQLAESSGHKSLDQAALETVRRLEKLPNPPRALAWKKKQLNIPIKYDLDRRG